ncbi:MAG: polysaccharide deacetylase family protein [Bacteroidia bacterium]
MRFYFTNKYFKYLLPKCTWRLKSSDSLYLTFDDGPTPEVTPWVLDVLKENKVKATFFCVGANVEKYPKIYQRVLDEGHSVGNHTYSHKSAWQHLWSTWLIDFRKAEKVINSKIMRPPYGKIWPWQASRIRKLGYEIIMWTFITYDFDPTSDPSLALAKMKKLKKGSIIVMHDQPKAKNNLKVILPELFEIFKGRSFEKF